MWDVYVCACVKFLFRSNQMSRTWMLISLGSEGTRIASLALELTQESNTCNELFCDEDKPPFL